MVTKTYFCLLSWEIWVTSICHKPLDLRLRGLVPIICKAGVAVRGACFYYPLELNKGIWGSRHEAPLYLCVSECEWNWSACSVEAVNVPVEVVWSTRTFPLDIRPGRRL